MELLNGQYGDYFKLGLGLLTILLIGFIIWAFSDLVEIEYHDDDDKPGKDK